MTSSSGALAPSTDVAERAADAVGPVLIAARDRRTGAVVFPLVPATSPLARWFDPVPLSATGTLYSFTVIHPKPGTADPFVLAYVDFPEGARVFGRLELAPAQRPAIGAKVRALVHPEKDAPYHFILAE
jgi:uncharacterized OB-fold protein